MIVFIKYFKVIISDRNRIRAIFRTTFSAVFYHLPPYLNDTNASFSLKDKMLIINRNKKALVSKLSLKSTQLFFPASFKSFKNSFLPDYQWVQSQEYP